MPDKVSRRFFLKSGLMAAGALAATGIPMPQTAEARSGNQLCTLLDTRKCIGCEACVEACRDVNESKFPESSGDMPVMYPKKKVRIEDWSSPEKREVTDRLTPYNWLFIQRAEGIYDEEDFELNIPRRCMHCLNAPCSNLCPFGAAYQMKNGIIRIHPDLCMGGAKCRSVCPWHIPQRQSGVGLHLNLLPQYAGNGVMYKCDRCFDRIADGELPACIEVCPEEVQEIGPREEIIGKARQIAEKIEGFVYGEKENGGTNTIYISPVPFEVLDNVVEKSHGKPHLAHAGNAMATTNTLLAAVAVAPVAGILGAVINLAKDRDNSKDKAEKS